MAARNSWQTSRQPAPISIFLSSSCRPDAPPNNGGVERGNRTFQEEFYFQPNLLADTIGAMRYELGKAVTKYNAYRPHRALNGITPLAYLQANPKGESPEPQAA